MSFASVKNNQASEKFYLVRLAPSRFINSYLSPIGGGIYTATIDLTIFNLKENGMALTKVTTVSGTGEWSYNESTNLLTVQPNSAPSNTNAIVIDYYLFYTGGRFRTVGEDPETPTANLREWLPRIKSFPAVTQDQSQVVNGFLSISMSSIVLINDQNEFQLYLTDNDSFYKKDVKVWIVLDEISNIQKIFDGRTTELSIVEGQEDTITINFDDPFSNILDNAFMGDESSDVYYSLDDFPNMDTNSADTPISYIFGSVSRYQLLPETISGLTTAKKIDDQTLYNAINTNYSSDVTTSNNRTWGCCRVEGTNDFGFTPSNVDNSAGGYTRLDGSSGEIAKIFIGDTFSMTQSGTFYGRVLDVDRVNNYVYITKEASISTGVVINSNKMPTVIVTNNNDETYYALFGRDYSVNDAATTGGNRYLSITFVNNFEANHAGLSILDPGSYSVVFRVHPDTTNMLHGSVVKSLLEASGLTVNAASITTANTALSVNAGFSIPLFEEGDYGQYQTYLEKILLSTMGYLSLNNDFEIEYHLFTTPSSSTEITETDIIKSTFRININYQDIITKLIAFNPHHNSDEHVSLTGLSKSSNKARYLHGKDKTDRMEHVLEDISTRLQDILDVRAERYATYSFNTKIEAIDKIIGDQVKLNKTGLLGGVGTENVTIVSLGKSPKNTSVTTTDLLDI